MQLTDKAISTKETKQTIDYIEQLLQTEDKQTQERPVLASKLTLANLTMDYSIKHMDPLTCIPYLSL